MEREIRQLLAEVGLMATGVHQHSEAESIAQSLANEEGTEQAVAMIRAMSLMNRGKYEQAEQLLTPLCSSYSSLVPFAALAAGKAGLSSKAEFWLKHAVNGSEESQVFADSFSRELRSL
jgi:type III secretion protein G